MNETTDVAGTDAGIEAVHTPSFQIGMTALFRGYTPDGNNDLPTQILEVDQRVLLSASAQFGGFTATPVDADMQATGSPADTVFPEELAVDPEAEVMVLDTPPAMTTKAKGKAKGKAAAETAPVVAEVQAKGKGKAKAKAAPVEAPVEAPVVVKGKGKAKAKAAPVEALAEQTDLVETFAVDVPTQTTLAPTVAPHAASSALVDSDSVLRLLEDQDALSAAKSLVNAVGRSYFELGGVLHHIYTTGAHKAAGFDGKRGFADYADRELGIGYRKAMYYMEMYVSFRALGIDETRLESIGWSKAKELSKIATADNFEELAEIARTKTRTELQAHIEREFVDPSDSSQRERVAKVKMHFTLFADQSETVGRALEAAQAQVGGEDINQALEYICAEWLQTAEGVEVSLADTLALVSARYGVPVVVQEDTNSVTAE